MGSVPLSSYREILYGRSHFTFLVSSLTTPLLATASIALVIGLIRQARVIRREGRAISATTPGFAAAILWESGLRLLLAGTLFASLVARLFCEWRLVKLPARLIDYEDPTTNLLWILAVLAAMRDASVRVAASAGLRRRWPLELIVWIGLCCLAVYVLVSGAAIPFLVHAGVRGVDAAHSLADSRYYIMSTADEWQILVGMSSASAAAVGAIALLVGTLATQGLAEVWRPRRLAAIGFLLLAAGIGRWHYEHILTQFSPDIASVGIGSNWWERLGGTALACLLVTCVIYRAWKGSVLRNTCDAPPTVAIEVPPAAEQWGVASLLFVAALLKVTQTYHEMNQLAAMVQNGLVLLLGWPSTYLTLALFLLSIQLLWQRWRGSAPAPLAIVPLRPRQFIAAWLLLAVALAVAVLTLAAFSFSFWLGPWYRW